MPYNTPFSSKELFIDSNTQWYKVVSTVLQMICFQENYNSDEVSILFVFQMTEFNINLDAIINTLS
jgi:hypothetical protein